jgi:hypothetical protein
LHVTEIDRAGRFYQPIIYRATLLGVMRSRPPERVKWNFLQQNRREKKPSKTGRVPNFQISLQQNGLTRARRL